MRWNQMVLKCQHPHTLRHIRFPSTIISPHSSQSDCLKTWTSLYRTLELGCPSAQNLLGSFYCCCKIHFPFFTSMAQHHLPASPASRQSLFHWALLYPGPCGAAQSPRMLFPWFWGCLAPPLPLGLREEVSSQRGFLWPHLCQVYLSVTCRVTMLVCPKLRVSWKVRLSVLKWA